MAKQYLQERSTVLGDVDISAQVQWEEGQENVGKDAMAWGTECLQPLPCVLSAHTVRLIHGPSELHNMFLTYIL